MRGDQARHRVGLAIDLYNADGQVFVVRGAYASLSEVGERRAADMADRAWMERLNQELKRRTRVVPGALWADSRIGTPACGW